MLKVFCSQQVQSQQFWSKPDTKNEGKIILSLQWIQIKHKEESTGAKNNALVQYSEVVRKACSLVVLSALRQPAWLHEIRYSWKVGQCSQSDWVPSLTRLMNKILSIFLYNYAPSWTADVFTCFKFYYDRKMSPWPLMWTTKLSF